MPLPGTLRSRSNNNAIIMQWVFCCFICMFVRFIFKVTVTLSDVNTSTVTDEKWRGNNTVKIIFTLQHI